MITKNIVLTGFMGCGKTTVGKVLAQKLVKKFIDVDVKIERSAGMSIKDIFANFGEEHFRKLESDEIEKISSQNNCVVATGGGVVLNAKNICALRKNGIIVYLKCGMEKIEQNLSDDLSRPLLQSGFDAAYRLYAEREALYENCDIIIDAGGGVDEIVEKILIEVENVS